MSERYEEVPRDETVVTEVRREPPDGPPPGGPPPWWRENWWIPALVLLLLVGLLIAFFALRDRGDEEAATEQATVPSLIGLDESDAREVLEREGLEADVAERRESDEPEGTVISQRPEAGTALARGGVVELILSAGEPEVVTETAVVTETDEEVETDVETQTETVEEEPEAVQVPDAVGLAQTEAGAAVEDAGLIANTFPVESQEERGTVVAQNPDPGTQLREGDAVRLNVSLGPDEREQAAIPNVTGAEEADARRALREAGFTVRTLDRQAPEPRHVGVVILQRPEPRQAPVLTQVTIYVGR